MKEQHEHPYDCFSSSLVEEFLRTFRFSRIVTHLKQEEMSLLEGKEEGKSKEFLVSLCKEEFDRRIHSLTQGKYERGEAKRVEWALINSRCKLRILNYSKRECP